MAEGEGFKYMKSDSLCPIAVCEAVQTRIRTCGLRSDCIAHTAHALSAPRELRTTHKVLGDARQLLHAFAVRVERAVRGE